MCDLVAEAVGTFGVVRMKVFGASMFPAIWPGDILSLGKIDPLSLSTPDVIVFRRGSRLYAHRFVARIGVGPRLHVMTSGDALDAPDLPVPICDVIGRAFLIERGPFRIDPRASVGPLWRLALIPIAVGRALRGFGCRTKRQLIRPLAYEVR
jgi:hypothetical protein